MPSWLARLVGQARAAGLQLTGEGGQLQQLIKRVLEAALDGEITEHLGFGKGRPVWTRGCGSTASSRTSCLP